MICSLCQRDNDAGTELCGRCGTRMERNLPPLLVLESMFTREVIWGINAAGIVLPLGLLVGGFLGAWIVWSSQGISSGWGIGAFAFFAPGAIFAFSILPIFRRVQSLLFGIGMLAMFGLIVAPIGSLVLALYLLR